MEEMSRKVQNASAHRSLSTGKEQSKSSGAMAEISGKVQKTSTHGASSSSILKLPTRVQNNRVRGPPTRQGVSTMLRKIPVLKKDVDEWTSFYKVQQTGQSASALKTAKISDYKMFSADRIEAELANVMTEYSITHASQINKI